MQNKCYLYKVSVLISLFLNPILEHTLHLNVVLGKISELSNVSREQGDFLYTSAFENFTIMHICVVSFFYMLPLRESSVFGSTC